MDRSSAEAPAFATAMDPGFALRAPRGAGGVQIVGAGSLSEVDFRLETRAAPALDRHPKAGATRFGAVGRRNEVLSVDRLNLACAGLAQFIPIPQWNCQVDGMAGILEQSQRSSPLW